MELMRKTFACVFWGCLVFQLTGGCRLGSEESGTKALQDEGRGRHRLQLLFPLLLRISTRLATLVPTALMVLLGVIVFVVFSKKALIASLLALFLTVSGKFGGGKTEDIHIHKVDTYPEYNDEEHIHYHHGPTRYKEVYYPSPGWGTVWRRAAPYRPDVFWEDDGGGEWYGG